MPIPICVSCGRETKRLTARYGKGIYRCTNPDCPDAFKVSYQRPGRKDKEKNA